jgi:hypothetical protein
VTGGTENRKKTIVAGVLGGLALIALIVGYNEMFGGSSAPPPAPPVVATGSTNGTRINSNGQSSGQTSAQTSAQTSGATAGPVTGLGAAPGVAATKMASTSSSLDPTLDETAMLRTESLVYSGSGRNIFSLVYTPAAALVDTRKLPPARPGGSAVVAPPVNPWPPPPPPINLKFFGTALRANGLRQAFLLSGEDVYLAAQGDIVARKYKIVSIGSSSVQVEDLQNKDTQTLPLQSN